MTFDIMDILMEFEEHLGFDPSRGTACRQGPTPVHWNANKIFVGKPEEKRSLGIHNAKDVVCEGVDWLQRKTHTVMDLQVS
jgi:hypothetical protein